MNQSVFKNRLKGELFGRALQVPCCFCQRPLFFKHATLEHIRPMARGGTWDLANLAISCSPCNGERGTTDFDEFKRTVEARMARRTTQEEAAHG